MDEDEALYQEIRQLLDGVQWKPGELERLEEIGFARVVRSIVDHGINPLKEMAVIDG